MRLTFPYSEEEFTLDKNDASKGTVKKRMPWVPIRLYKGKTWTPPFTVLVDSGADQATFSPSVASQLGINYQSGIERPTQGIGTSKSWMHSGIALVIKDSSGQRVALELEPAGFDPNLPIAGLLGRASFFDAFHVTFDHPGETIHLDLIEGAAHLIDMKDVPIYKPPLPPNKRSIRQGRR